MINKNVCQIDLSAFQTNGKVKNGLPASAYTEAAFFQRECQSVLYNNWVFAGFVHELVNTGDTIPVKVAGQPIIFVKNEHGDIQAFHNVCSHRCLQLIDRKKNVGKLIRCPYHAWSYNLNGVLKATPHFGGTDQHTPEGFDPKINGLKPIRIHCWHDWIFVNLSGDAPAFAEYAKPLIDQLSGVDFEQVKPIAILDFGEIKTNWKFIMENFIEPYHVQFVHKTTTAQPLSDHYTIVDGLCLGSAVDLDEEDGAANSLAVSSRYLTLFPNFIVGRYFPDQLGVYHNVPIDATTMAQRRVLYTTENQSLSEAQVEQLKKLWWDVHREDHEICERMQQGRASSASNHGGFLSPHWEDSVRAFQELIVDSMTK